MPPKGSTSSAGRRKSGKPTAPAPTSADTPAISKTFMVTLAVPPAKLRAALRLRAAPRDSSPPKPSPPASAAGPMTNGSENLSETHTPAAASTPATAPTPLGDLAKRKALKRANPIMDAKPRAKPGPKKKSRLDDGSGDPTAPKASHKLGPKANQGAINAGLRALDRSGKPTRRWTRGTFRVKTFTGEFWEIPRWRTNPKPDPKPEEPQKDSAVGSASGSNKENKRGPAKTKSDESATVNVAEPREAPAASGPSADSAASPLTAAAPASASASASVPAPAPAASISEQAAPSA